MCARTGRHLATFTRRPGSSLYTLTAESPPTAESAHVAASSQMFAAASRSGPESAPCSCRLLSHQTLLWHHRLGHPSLPRLRGMASRVLISGLPRSLPPLPPGPGPTCIPCVEGRQRAAPHSSEFPPTEAPLQTLHMDVWGPARVSGQGRERYFLLVVDDYSRYTTVFPLRSKGDVTKTFTLPASQQQNGIAERRIGMVMDVARTSMMHAAAPHFLWPFAVQYAAHQLNLQPQVSLPETSPALRWTGKVGDASAFRFYHPTTRRVLSSQDVTFDQSVPYYRLFPYRTTPLPPPPLFLARGATQVDPLPPQGPAPSDVSQVDAVEPVEVAVDSGVARGAEPAGVGSAGAGSGGAKSRGAETGGTEPGGAKPWGAESGDAEPGGAGSARVAAGGTSSRREPLSPQELRVWFARCWRPAAEPGGVGAGVSTGAGASGGAAEAAGADGPTGVGAAGAGAAGGVGAGVSTGAGASGGATEAGGAAGPTGVSAAGAGASEGTRVGAVGAGGSAGAGAAAGGTGAVLAGSRGAARPRPYFVPLLEQVLGLLLSTGPAPPLECPQPVQSKSQLPPASPLPAPSPYTESSLPSLADPESDSLRAASPSVTRLLATVVTDPSFESAPASALIAELVDFAARCRLDYATSLVAESESVCPPSIGGECALSTDVLEDRQEEFQCFATALPHLMSTLIAPEGDPDAPDTMTPRSYAEAIEGPYSS
ncbi:unnamed protein product [Closterium sp. NIES-64]|nr:unnamed protein product [Closterium sp. NIES-64]